MNKQITINVNAKFCKQCGVCAALCPKHVLEQKLGAVPKVAHPEDCIGCRLCAMRCPDFAIEVEVR